MKKLTWFAASVVLLVLLPASTIPARAAAGPGAKGETGPTVVRSKPAAPVEIDGVPCAAGYVFRFEATGRLSQCRLDRDAVVHNADLQEGNHRGAQPGWHHPVRVSARHDAGGGAQLPGQGHGWMTHFHPNGQLRLCWLSRDEVDPGRAMLPRHCSRGVPRREVRHHRVSRERRARELHRIGGHRRRRAALRGRRAGEAGPRRATPSPVRADFGIALAVLSVRGPRRQR
ncbi:MAG: hypothetical protein MZV63_23720 [Marinilabiliales bacterium]|nr:hypothetical protein [Marinilabiliales bacterium]